MKQITSRDNPVFRHALQLSQSSRERRKSDQTILDGVHLLQAYRDGVGVPEAVLLSEAALQDHQVMALLQGIPPQRVAVLSDALFHEISGLKSPTGILAVIATPRPGAPPRDLPACLMLEDVQDPGNMGSILRTAAAAGMRHVLLSRGCAFAWAPRVVRAGMGAHFRLGIHEGVDLVAAAAAFKGRVIAACVDAAHDLYATDLTGPVALVVGNEGAGVTPALLEVAHQRVAIPMADGVESLNAAAAAAVCLFERVRQVRGAPAGRRGGAGARSDLG